MSVLIFNNIFLSSPLPSSLPSSHTSPTSLQSLHVSLCVLLPPSSNSLQSGGISCRWAQQRSRRSWALWTELRGPCTLTWSSVRDGVLWSYQMLQYLTHSWVLKEGWALFVEQTVLPEVLHTLGLAVESSVTVAVGERMPAFLKVSVKSWNHSWQLSVWAAGGRTNYQFRQE